MSATNRGARRHAADFYATPESAFKPLLPYLPTATAIFEPACGDGRLVDWMSKAGLTAVGLDLQRDGFDYLKKPYVKTPCIVTNPPYSLAFSFARKAVEEAPEVFLLLRLNFLASKTRAAWFKQHEPAALFVLSQRPSFTGKGTDATDYAWFYWGPRHKGVFHL